MRSATWSWTAAQSAAARTSCPGPSKRPARNQKPRTTSTLAANATTGTAARWTQIERESRSRVSGKRTTRYTTASVTGIQGSDWTSEERSAKVSATGSPWRLPPTVDWTPRMTPTSTQAPATASATRAFTGSSASDSGRARSELERVRVFDDERTTGGERQTRAVHVHYPVGRQRLVVHHPQVRSLGEV